MYSRAIQCKLAPLYWALHVALYYIYINIALPRCALIWIDVRYLETKHLIPIQTWGSLLGVHLCVNQKSSAIIFLDSCHSACPCKIYTSKCFPGLQHSIIKHLFFYLVLPLLQAVSLYCSNAPYSNVLYFQVCVKTNSCALFGIESLTTSKCRNFNSEAWINNPCHQISTFYSFYAPIAIKIAFKLLS